MIKITQLTKSFSGQAVPTLNELNLQVASGEFCVLLGTNGSGKSTLMRVLSGEYIVDAGSLQVAGVDMTQQDRSSVIASVVQDVNAGTIASLTVLENMVLSLRRGSKGSFSSYQNDAARIAALIEGLGVGLERFLHQPMSTLSGGQRQMIATLMAVHSQPKVLLLDEHTAALDPKMQQILMAYTAHAVETYEITTLMVTHKLEDAVKYGDRLLMLKNGRIALDAAGAEKRRLTVPELLQLFNGG